MTAILSRKQLLIYLIYSWHSSELRKCVLREGYLGNENVLWTSEFWVYLCFHIKQRGQYAKFLKVLMKSINWCFDVNFLSGEKILLLFLIFIYRIFNELSFWISLLYLLIYVLVNFMFYYELYYLFMDYSTNKQNIIKNIL